MSHLKLRLEQSSSLNSTPEYVLVPREGTLILKCFCQYWFQTTGRHFNSIYRSRRVMLISFWPVKNTLLFENILASALGANWALWQCSAWLVHINTKGWKIQFCCSFSELSKKKDKEKKSLLQDWCRLHVWPGVCPNVFYWLCQGESRN